MKKEITLSDVRKKRPEKKEEEEEKIDLRGGIQKAIDLTAIVLPI